MITIHRIIKSRLPEVRIEELQALDFGRYLSDHMFICEYDGARWQEARIQPYDNLSLTPSLSALHYGQAVFEGMKAHRLKDGKVGIFRMDKHSERLNISAERLCLPPFPKELFLEAIERLVDIDRGWVPQSKGSALYIRPFMFGSDAQIMAAPSKKATFCIITSPVAPYFSKNLNIYVEDTYSRAALGGVGFAKAAGNYAASFMPTRKAQERGFDQVLWLDAEKHEIVQECGVMNIMFLAGDTFITPSLENGLILPGITRDSLLTVLREKGEKVEERQISIHELADWADQGLLQEAIGIGTGAILTFIESFTYKGRKMVVRDKSFSRAKALFALLTDLRHGELDYPFAKDWIKVI